MNLEQAHARLIEARGRDREAQQVLWEWLCRLEDGNAVGAMGQGGQQVQLYQVVYRLALLAQRDAAPPVRSVEGYLRSALANLRRDQFRKEASQKRGAESASAPRAARSLCERRDDLESVSFVLRAAGKAEVAELLRPIDRRAQAEAMAFGDAWFANDSERLSAVYLADPDAWWGRAWS